MNIKKFRKLDEWIEASLEPIKEAITIALSGGSTPEPIYEALGDRWISRKEFFQVDERYVSPDDPNSNQTMIQKYIPNLETFNTNLPIEECLTQYEEKLPEQFDLIILGMGPDGHVASLFPHSAALHETGKRVAHTTTSEFTVHDRLTLTLPPILNAKEILILLKGREKAKILDELENSDKTIDELPAKAVIDHANLTIHHLE